MPSNEGRQVYYRGTEKLQQTNAIALLGIIGELPL
jgi:hypothetical protein